MNNGNFQGPKGEPGPPNYDGMGVKDRIGVYGRMKKIYKQCFERRSECNLLTT